MLEYFKPILYVRLDPARIAIRDVHSGRELAEPPIAALSREPKRRLVGVGKAAEMAGASQAVDIINPFTHPRSLLSDFTVAELVLKGFVKKVFSERIFVPSPHIVMHPTVNPEG